MRIELIDPAEFEKMTPAEQRVAIARDVIARLDAELIKANNGYVIGRNNLNRNVKTKDSLNTAANCPVCARGALVCSWIGNFNKYDWDFIDGIRYDSPLNPELVELFGQEQIDLIECAFEGRIYAWHGNYPGRDKVWGSEIVIENQSLFGNLRRIMENIIDNGGTFVFDPSEDAPHPFLRKPLVIRLE